MAKWVFLYDEANYMDDTSKALTLEGAPRAIEEYYQQAVSKASWFAYNGMWRAAAKGVGLGMAIAGGLSITGAAFIGMLVNHAESTVWPVALANGGIEGISMLLTSSGGLLAATIVGIGAAAGAIYEVSNQQDVVQLELMKTRQQMRDLKGVIRDQEIGKEQAHAHALQPEKTLQAQPESPEPASPSDHILHDFDPMGEVNNQHGQQSWVQRHAARNAQAAQAAQAERGI